MGEKIVKVSNGGVRKRAPCLSRRKQSRIISTTLKNSNRQPQAMALKKILKRCSSLGKNKDGLPQDVPKGHFVVYIGRDRTRYIVPITWLAYPEFKTLLQRAGEEYGFKHDMGITIPCDEDFFRSLMSAFR